MAENLKEKSKEDGDEGGGTSEEIADGRLRDCENAALRDVGMLGKMRHAHASLSQAMQGKLVTRYSWDVEWTLAGRCDEF